MSGETTADARNAQDRPVVVGYLPTDEGRAAFSAALAEADQRNTSVLLVNSAHGGAFMDSQLATDSDLESLVDAGAEQGIIVIVRQFPTAPDPAEAVLQAIDDTNAGLLVIGLRRRSAVGKLLLGSTAQSLLMQAPIPVLTVKAPATARHHGHDQRPGLTHTKDTP